MSSTTTKLKYIKLVIFVSLLVWFWFSLPAKLFTAPTCFVITDAKGNLLNATIADDGQWRFPYNENVPEKFKQCIIAFEDKRFYNHPGVDPFAMLRAIKQNIGNKRTVSGGSTLTMQVMRLSKGNRNRSIWNKITESIAAFRLECSYNKNEVMAFYASNAPFGTNVVGLDAAAWRYYGRTAQNLSWGEMAALAVLPNAPSLVRPGKNTPEFLRKRNNLLGILLSQKIIDAPTYETAVLEPLPAAPQPLPQLAPHLVQRFKKDYTLNKKAFNTTAVTTTIDKQLQQQLNEITARYHNQYKGNSINNIAAMIMETESGNIVAYTGNNNEVSIADMESQVDILSSPRSPGSTLKPLLYAGLLTEGTMLPEQLIPDIPTQIGGYTPQNFDLGYDGVVPANRALSRSLNIPAVKMLQNYKYQKFYSLLKQCGFTTLNNNADFYGLSLILGGCEIKPYELAGVYSSLARMYMHETKNKGKWNSADLFMPRYIKNETPETNSENINTQLFDYTALWHMFNAMNEVARPGEEGLWGMFSSAQRIAWKTGTSFGFRDAWSIGLNTKYTVVVWVGNADGEGRPELTGIKTAAPVMFEIFRLLPKANWFTPPTTNVNYLGVCRQTGYKAGPDCDSITQVLVSANGKNAPLCPYHKKIHLDRTGTYRVTAACEQPQNMQHRTWLILPPTIEYYYRKTHAGYKPLPPFMQGCTEETKQLDIIYPEDKARIFVPKEINGNKGRVVFTATHRNSEAKLFWHLDDAFIATTTRFHQLGVNPAKGWHTLTVVDENGESVGRTFEIVE